MFAIKPAAANSAFTADDQDRQWLDKAMVWVGGFSDVARECACGGVLFFALSDWAEKVSARRTLWFKVFWVVMFSVLPFNVCTKASFRSKAKSKLLVMLLRSLSRLNHSLRQKS